jgi:2-methylcitrate dehydratase PrpD
MTQYRFSAKDVQRIVIAGEEKLTSHHAIYEPKDVMMAQYSIPYCVALAFFANPEEPESFSEDNLSDSKILELARQVELRIDGEINQMKGSRAAKVIVQLKDGRELRHEILHFRGTPQNPLTREDLCRKVKMLACHAIPEEKVDGLIEKVLHLEEVEDMGTLLL